MYKIVRHKGGRLPTRHNIVLKNLSPRYKEILLNNYHIKEFCEDDRFLMIIFKMKDDEINNIRNKKLYINPQTGKINNFVQIKRNSQLIDWKCAECNRPIKSHIKKFIPENFLCKRCQPIVKNKKYLPETVMTSSYNFMLHCKSLILDNQKKIIKYIKKNEKD